MDIVRQAAVELALMVDATRRALTFPAGESVPVSYSGGVFDNTGTLLLQHFASSLHELWPAYEVTARRRHCRRPSAPRYTPQSATAGPCRARR